MENLRHLISAYFHQDWVLDGGQSVDTVRAFLSEPREVVHSCADQIDMLLARDFREGELGWLLEEWGNGYDAGEGDAEYRAWLSEIRDQIRAFLSTPAAAP